MQDIASIGPVVAAGPMTPWTSGRSTICGPEGRHGRRSWRSSEWESCSDSWARMLTGGVPAVATAPNTTRNGQAGCPRPGLSRPGANEENATDAAVSRRAGASRPPAGRAPAPYRRGPAPAAESRAATLPCWPARSGGDSGRAGEKIVLASDGRLHFLHRLAFEPVGHRLEGFRYVGLPSAAASARTAFARALRSLSTVAKSSHTVPRAGPRRGRLMSGPEAREALDDLGLGPEDRRAERHSTPKERASRAPVRGAK